MASLLYFPDGRTFSLTDEMPSATEADHSSDSSEMKYSPQPEVEVHSDSEQPTKSLSLLSMLESTSSGTDSFLQKRTVDFAMNECDQTPSPFKVPNPKVRSLTYEMSPQLKELFASKINESIRPNESMDFYSSETAAAAAAASSCLTLNDSAQSLPIIDIDMRAVENPTANTHSFDHQGPSNFILVTPPDNASTTNQSIEGVISESQTSTEMSIGNGDSVESMNIDDEFIENLARGITSGESYVLQINGITYYCMNSVNQEGMEVTQIPTTADMNPLEIQIPTTMSAVSDIMNPLEIQIEIANPNTDIMNPDGIQIANITDMNPDGIQIANITDMNPDGIQIANITGMNPDGIQIANITDMNPKGIQIPTPNTEIATTEQDKQLVSYNGENCSVPEAENGEGAKDVESDIESDSSQNDEDIETGYAADLEEDEFRHGTIVWANHPLSQLGHDFLGVVVTPGRPYYNELSSRTLQLSMDLKNSLEFIHGLKVVINLSDEDIWCYCHCDEMRLAEIKKRAPIIKEDYLLSVD